MSDPAFYLWVEEKPWHRNEHWRERKEIFKELVPLKSKTIEEARSEAIEWLDHYSLQERVYLDLKHAIIYSFQMNITMLYEKDKALRQSAITKKRKQDELKKAEAEVARLKQELLEG